MAEAKLLLTCVGVRFNLAAIGDFATEKPGVLPETIKFEAPNDIHAFSR